MRSTPGCPVDDRGDGPGNILARPCNLFVAIGQVLPHRTDVSKYNIVESYIVVHVSGAEKNCLRPGTKTFCYNQYQGKAMDTNALPLLLPLLGFVSGQVCPMPDTSYIPGRPPAWLFGPVWALLYFLIGVVGREVLSASNGTHTALWGAMVTCTLLWPAMVSCGSPQGRWWVGLAGVGCNLATSLALLVAMASRRGGSNVHLALVPFFVWNMFAGVLSWSAIVETSKLS